MCGKIQRKIWRKVRTAKENCIKDRCAKIEEYQKKHDLFNVHQKIKEATGKITRKTLSLLKDASENCLVEINDKLLVDLEEVRTLGSIFGTIGENILL